MSLGNPQFVESIIHSPEPDKEYRIRNGKVEARVLGSGQDSVWLELSPEQLSSHVRENTTVARWLEQSLGWRRLLRACVGQ
jgi:hypothetical protein